MLINIEISTGWSFHIRCIPDIAPFNFYTFSKLEDLLEDSILPMKKGQHFANEETCKAAVLSFFKKQGRECYDAGIVKLYNGMKNVSSELVTM